MSDIKIAVFVGSLRKASINRKLAAAVQKLFPDGYAFEDVRIDDLPLYDQDFDADYPIQGRRLKAQIAAADALLFVTPEYNRSIPGVLKNALDVGSRPYGQSPFPGKPAGVLGASVGAIGTALAQQHLRNVLSYLDVATLPAPEVFVHFKDGLIDDAGEIANEGTRKFLQGFVDRYVAWIARFR